MNLKENINYPRGNDYGKKNWSYKLESGIKIKLFLAHGYDNIKITIGDRELATELISEDILKELIDFFTEKEAEIKTDQNSELFNKTIKSRIDANKYNL